MLLKIINVILLLLLLLLLLLIILQVKPEITIYNYISARYKAKKQNDGRKE